MTILVDEEFFSRFYSDYNRALLFFMTDYNRSLLFFMTDYICAKAFLKSSIRSSALSIPQE
jgi:hypothetical protein